MEAPPPPRPAAYGRVKLSPFWPNNPVTWFAMAEGQFILNNIRADRGVASLLTSQMASVRLELASCVAAPPSDNH